MPTQGKPNISTHVDDDGKGTGSYNQSCWTALVWGGYATINGAADMQATVGKHRDRSKLNESPGFVIHHIPLL